MSESVYPFKPEATGAVLYRVKAAERLTALSGWKI